ncbi:MAG TPA: hypothetical protein VJH03_17975 [Blastocatellia bacterium]|nr:hypothetical protein [Blastocatellia bacterium]
MKEKLKALLVLTLSVGAISYAVLESGIAVNTVHAEWSKGCCVASSDCGSNLICYRSDFPSNWGQCGYVLRFNNDGTPYVENAYGYCNTASNPDWSNQFEIEQ